MGSIAGAGISAAGAVAGATIQGDAIKSAAQAQADAAKAATAAQLQMYGQTRQDQTPWRVTGEGALSQLAGLYNIQVPQGTYADLTSPATGQTPGTGTTPTSGTGGTGQLTGATPLAGSVSTQNTPATMPTPGAAGAAATTSNGVMTPGTTAQQLQAMTGNTNSAQTPFYASPDFNFRMQQGLAGVDAGAAAGGQLDSGATRKAEMTYGANLGTSAWNDYANRLSAMAGVGQTSATATGQAGTNTANQISQIAQNAGNNQASSYAAQGQLGSNVATSLAGMASGLVSNWGSSQLGQGLNWMNNGAELVGF